MLIDLNPKILIWAREERGVPVEEAAKKIKIDVQDLKKWEQDGKNIPFGTLEIIARIYKRQTAVFFLPATPDKVKKVKDFRNLAKSAQKFSPDTLLAMRRTERYLEAARDVLDVPYWNKQYEWAKNYSGKKEKIKQEADSLREILAASSTKKGGHKRADAAFRYWRTKIEEKLSIFVFQFSMPEDELDGFSYALDKFPYAIVINNKKSAVRKNFTLFHELEHILKHTPGACKTQYSTGKQFEIELECNSFAGNFLVPTEDLEVADSANEIYRKSDQFNISGEVYLRRLHEERLINKKDFFLLLEEVRKKSDSFPRTQSEGHPSMLIQSKSTRGNKFFKLVSDAAVNNNMSFSAASDLLGLKVGNIR